MKLVTFLFIASALTGCVTGYTPPQSGNTTHIKFKAGTHFEGKSHIYICTDGRKGILGRISRGTVSPYKTEVLTGEPLTIGFDSSIYTGSYQVSCGVISTFIPETGKLYEVLINVKPKSCNMSVLSNLGGEKEVVQLRTPSPEQRCNK